MACGVGSRTVPPFTISRRWILTFITIKMYKLPTVSELDHATKTALKDQSTQCPEVIVISDDEVTDEVDELVKDEIDWNDHDGSYYSPWRNRMSTGGKTTPITPPTPCPRRVNRISTLAMFHRMEDNHNELLGRMVFFDAKLSNLEFIVKCLPKDVKEY